MRLGAGTGASGGYFALNTLLSANSANIASGTSFSIDLTTTSFGTAFNGKDATSGTWTLFFADTVPVDTTTLNGWSLDVTTVPAVPEPVNMALACFAGVLLTVVGVRRVVTRRALATN